MIIIHSYMLKHSHMLSCTVQGSVGQLNLQLSESKRTLHRRKHGESYFIRWRSFKGASCNIHHLHVRAGVPMRTIAADLNHQICKHTHGKETAAHDR